MPSTHPEAVIQQFAAALQSGDLETMLDLYEPDATFAPEPGRASAGATRFAPLLSRSSRSAPE